MEISKPFISVVVPCRNEEKYVGNVLSFLNVQEYPKERMEVFIVDGASTDKTVKIVEDFKGSNSFLNIYVLNNVNKTVPFALNIGLEKCIGDYVIRLDAHTKYAVNYFVKIVETFEKTSADIVGGPMRAIGETVFQKTVAYCTSTKFGVGDSRFHNEKAEGFTDSVYLGAWKRELFPEVGLFDIRLKRNQDDEFHYRAKSMGKKIYLNPEIKSWYYPRSDIKSLFNQYFQYGFYKPLVLRKVSSEIKLRHLIPSFFFLYLCFLPILYVYCDYLAFVFLLLYISCDVYFSLVNRNLNAVKFYSLIVYPVLHFSYGIGFIGGIVKLFENK